MSNKSHKNSEPEKIFDINNAVEEVIQEMLKDKQAHPDLIIPYSFLEFYNQPEMIDLLSSALNYAKSLFSINKEYLFLKHQGKHSEAKLFSDRQGFLLPDLGRELAKKYGHLLLNQRNLALEDQSFYETVIFFIIKVLKSDFTAEQGVILEEELNRLFRSTAFNISQRKNTEGAKYIKFPQLKTSPKKDPDTVIEHIMLRNLVSKTTKSKSYSLDGIKRPAFVRISPFKAISSRSPLISLLLPSAKDKIREIDELRRKILNKKPRLSPIRH